MAGLQRSAQTFRRSGSSGLVWDERFLTEGAAEDGGTGKGPRPELRHSRSVGSAGMLLWRRGHDEAEDDDDKRRKLVLAKPKEKDDHRKQEKEAPGRKAFRTRDVAPAADLPSPRVSSCCAIFRVAGAGGSLARRGKPRKR